ncbi:sugar phosphate isomerase/epimerase [Microbacterium oryzae]|uniref:sugar phosphate isomerase/epimerase family protein n=1 Tax=Microbacterium oryzae TaxID=743009 RepID=UPI0025B0288D|nr:sugar phosphate isomerase/epimerase [Microbacterium oryzae]MDN3310916.1 sugar phosphate isomerase/epimerase [Microbacterium oryzae]
MSDATVALQLYTIRDAVAQDVDAALARAAEIGFTQIELFNIVEWRPQLEAALAAHGLAAPTAHAPLSVGEPERAFEAAQALGVTTLIDPFIAPERWTSRDEVLRIADELAANAEKARSYGLSFGYHNHNWEIENRFDGQTALEVLAGALPDDVALEVDAYWAAVGGADVPALLETLGSRVRFLHIKDAPEIDGALSKDREDQLPAGQGAIAWQPVLEAAPQTELLVVEFDEYRGDIFDGIAQGLAGTRALLGA